MENNKIKYLERTGKDKNIVILHGFAETAKSWDSVVAFLPENYRILRPELSFAVNGNYGDDIAGFVDRLCDFICENVIGKLILVGHSTGAKIALLMLQNPKFREKVESLIVIGGPELNKIPNSINLICNNNSSNLFFRFNGSELPAYRILSLFFDDEEKITQYEIDHILPLTNEQNRELFIEEAKAYLNLPKDVKKDELFCKFNFSVLLINGELDRVFTLENVELLQQNFINSELEIIPEAGHTPQTELPELTASVIINFISEEPNEYDEELTDNSSSSTMASVAMGHIKGWSEPYKLKMSRLIDSWSLGALLVLVFLKILQLLKKMGMKPEENGWRKATGIFLRNEYSKFTLLCSRLYYYKNEKTPQNFDEARELLISNLFEYIIEKSELHWSAAPGKFQLSRRRIRFIDIAMAKYSSSGKLLDIKFYFEPGQDKFQVLNQEHIDKTINKFVKTVNILATKPLKNNSTTLNKYMNSWAKRSASFSFTARQELKMLIERLMNATYIHFEIMDETQSIISQRISSPNLKRYRNPTWGLLNIIARFTPDYSEVDLWMQYHHVPVDGLPMQELLAELKQRWGSAGELIFPSLNSPESNPEIIYAGNRLFRCRFMVDFEDFLKIRKEVNSKYVAEMDGAATIAGMLIWGMAHHYFFRNAKMLFPVDMPSKEANSADRELGLVFISAGKYFRNYSPFESFISFQKEFNQRLFRTRMGNSESHELLELYSMIHPIFYRIAQYLMPEVMGEFVGTSGISILKNSEIFISPLSDIQVNGFMTLGNMTHPTVDGKKVGVVSACGNKEQMRFFMNAVNDLAKNYRSFLEFPQE